MNKRLLLMTALLTVSLTISSIPFKADGDSTQMVTAEKKTSPWLKPVKWFAKNWTGYDPAYSVPSFYNWAFQLQNTSSIEWLQTSTPEGMDLVMRSKMSHRIGPYIGWRFLFQGFTVDIGTLGESTKRKNEFTLSINSNLMNIDLIRRRTGGDFIVSKLNFTNPYTKEVTDMRYVADMGEVGELIQNDLTGFNLNYFINHRRYSNPAAFSNGAIQLRSVGSPIVGFGYTHQKVKSDFSELFSSFGSLMTVLSSVFMVDDEGKMVIDIPEFADVMNRYASVNMDNNDEVESWMLDFADVMWPYLEGNDLVKTFLTNHIPSKTTIDDWHLQLGYAYNLVFSRRLMLGVSLVASPGIKRVRADNKGSVSYRHADRLAQIIETHQPGYQVPGGGDFFRYKYDDSHVNLNLMAKASLVYNYNRWRAGVMGTFNRYYYRHNDMIVNNRYGDVAVYVGYCFGRKKAFRYDGESRQQYIEAALTKSQIEEMRDTCPKSNLKMPLRQYDEEPSTPRYHTDHFTFNISGCDLVKGPDGIYGSFTVEDGFVTQGQDSEGRLPNGTVMLLDKDGTITCEAGHKSSFRTANWWKNQLDINEIPNHWYPEMLHYVLRGKLVMYLRGRIFGTKKPVKVEIPDVYLAHGKETHNYMLLGIDGYRSHSTFSVEGRAKANGKDYRVYIEQQKHNKEADVFISRVYKGHSDWMNNVDDNRAIATLSVPGTHDSGSASLTENNPLVDAGHTQNFSPETQLEDGIRAFDIRLKNDLHYGHTFKCRHRFDSTLVAWDKFLDQHPSECIIAMVGSDEGGKWNDELKSNFQQLIDRYPNRFIEQFSPTTRMGDVRGKILVIRRQEECPYGKLLKFEDNTTFDYDCFRVEDEYKQFKSYKKIKIVERHIREAFENEDPNRWYITFASISWSPRRHYPYNYAWGGKAKNIRKPINKNLHELIELKGYGNFGIVYLDFYNDHGEQPQLVTSIINSNFLLEDED